ncbi:hypothetical protein CLV59_101950 [Chitinophaga dinghuensis]|uniref:Zn-dependent protease DUF2268 n=1 Tax=Chitinophaga dinghuensis TaxID=1539050 RepID=A0A327WC49_9BACT|nr:hypothetical protein [Chitinophaga dinghuensis]RAJ88183.1 hypothetical protein CLV59_101950 [Chitinophaga dinghuensis]
MKKSICLLLSVFTVTTAFSQGKSPIVTTDIPLFWNAYDAVTATTDSSRQAALLQTMYFDKGSAGLKAMMEARRYTVKDYMNAIRRYPEFWKTIRPNMMKVDKYAAEIQKGITAFKKIYPAKPASIYFTVGAMRSNGTTQADKVLIGAEIAMADSSVVTTEFPDQLGYLKTFFSSNPIKDLPFLNIHEYVHTQQKSTIGELLLTQCVIEGVAEFVAVKAMGIPSPNPPIAFGKANDIALKEAFSKCMFSPFTDNWLYNNAKNAFGMRDLGYYMGYAICEKYYEQAKDKKAAIKSMIELDYNNESLLYQFVDSTHYFDQPVSVLKAAYEASRPVVSSISGFDKGFGGVVAPGKHQIVIQFSQPLDKRFRNFEIGPAGESAVMRVQKVVGFTTNPSAIIVDVDLLPNKHYQLVLGEEFRTKESIPLRKYLIDITTGE